MLFPTFSLSAAVFAGLTAAQFNGLPTCAVSLAPPLLLGLHCMDGHKPLALNNDPHQFMP